MRIKLLIATDDCDYAGHLSDFLSENHADTIDVSVCSTTDSMAELLKARRFDVALLDGSLAGDTDSSRIHLPLQLWSEAENTIFDGSPDTVGGHAGQAGPNPYDRAGNRAADEQRGLRKINKYQRISSIAANVLEQYAKILTCEQNPESKKAFITAVWSPSGGAGKTTVALAYASRKATDGKQVFYLNLEPFSSAPVYLAQTGKSISAVFEMLETHEGSIKMLIRSMRQFSSETGVSYLGCPENYDDMNILSAEDVAALITACSGTADELVIDMSSQCDERTRKTFDLADRILLVTDSSCTTQIKYAQFTSQNNVFKQIRSKAALVMNKGAAVGDSPVEAVIRLPLVQSSDANTVYKTLSGNNFD